MIAKILFDDRGQHQYDPRAAAETDLLVQMILPLTRSIPLACLYASYVVAKEARDPNDKFHNAQISGDEILRGWKLLSAKLEMQSREPQQKLIADVAISDCDRCFGTGFEVDPGRGARRCSHAPLSDEERERRGLKFEGTAEDYQRQVFEMLGKMSGAARPIVRTTDEARGEELVCNKCGRRVNTLQGWRFGETCKQIVRPNPSTCDACGGEAHARIDPSRLICSECGAEASRLCSGQMETPPANPAQDASPDAQEAAGAIGEAQEANAPPETPQRPRRGRRSGK